MAAWIVVGGFITACATTAIQAGVPYSIEGVALLPYARHEICVSMKTGDRLDWRYSSTTPLAFEIHYREGNALVASVVRTDSTEDSDTFAARLDENYCATWDAGASGAKLSYRLLLGTPYRDGIAGPLPKPESRTPNPQQPHNSP